MSASHDFYAAEPIPVEAQKELQDILQSGDLFRYTRPGQSPVFELEKAFAEFTGSQYALAVSSCSAALLLSLKALGVKPGSRVLMPGFTFAAVPSAVVNAGCVPVLVNVGKNFRIDLDDFLAKIGQDIDVVLISHMRGHTSDMDVIAKVCEENGIPLLEDAAHSLGTTWNGQRIGAIGKIGCFSFQSYKLLNAGEGGMIITDDPDLIAQMVIMSGAYEHNWKKHPVVSDRFAFWQNKLPLFNMRMSNLSAVVLKPQIGLIEQRSRDGLAHHDYVAERLNQSPYFDVPPPLPQEKRAPDSIQFNLVGFETEDDVKAFQARAKEKGLKVEVFGLSHDNARVFWNWQFIKQPDDLGATREMLERACDVRLPTHLGQDALDFVVTTLLEAAAEVHANAENAA